MKKKKSKKDLLGTTRIPLPEKTGGAHKDKSKYNRKKKYKWQKEDD